MSVMAARRVAAAFFALVKLRANKLAEFALHNAVMCVGVIDHFLAQLGVLIERQMASIDHHAGKPFVDALFAQFEGVAMIEVHRDRNGRKTYRRFDQLFEVNRVGVLTRSFGNLQHHRSFFFFAGLR